MGFALAVWWVVLEVKGHVILNSTNPGLRDLPGPS